MGFRLVPTSLTLNDLECHNSPYFAFYSPNLTDFQADYITLVEDRPMYVCMYVCIREFITREFLQPKQSRVHARRPY